MSDLDATTPRVFIARHEWTKNGRYTGTTELELTPAGVRQVEAAGAQFLGGGKLVDVGRIARVWVSPRRRARETYRLLFGGGGGGGEDYGCGFDAVEKLMLLSDDLAEWDYGDYEGLLVGEIRALRKERGLDREREWNIWKDGCEGGESAQQVAERLDRLIAQIREIQAPYMHGEKPADVVLVAHGLILRAFVKRWLKYPLENPLPMLLSPGAIGILSYKNHDINEPGFFIGMAIPSQG